MSFRRLSLVLPLVFAATAAAEPDVADGDRAPEPLEIGGFAGAMLRTGDVGVDEVESSVAFGLRGGFASSPALTLEGELSFVPTQARETNAELLLFGFRARGLYHVGSQARFTPYLGAGIGGATSSQASYKTEHQELLIPLRMPDTDLVFEAGAGVKWRVARRLVVRFDVRAVVAPLGGDGFEPDGVEFLVGALAPFAMPKRGAASVVARGPSAKSAATAASGAAKKEDADGDGILDDSDQCPDEPEEVNGIEDEDGCGHEDPDGDGIFAALDLCPDEPEDGDAHLDEDGCPEADNDDDSIEDPVDQCPDEAEVRNGFQDRDGCPDEVPPDIARVLGPTKLRFPKNRSTLTAARARPLDEVAAAFREHPELAIRIVVISSDAPSEEANVELSKRRATIVKAELIRRGISKDRIATEGRAKEEGSPVVEIQLEDGGPGHSSEDGEPPADDSETVTTGP